MSTVPAIGLIVGCYLVGAVPFGLIVVRAARGIDIRTAGSGNIGTTNVARVAGKKLAILVFLLDFAKGYLPVLGVHTIVTNHGADQLVPVAAGLATVVGHMFPVYLKFKGGKGVATGAGMLAALVPWALGVSFLVWVFVVGATRYISLGSMSAAVALPVSFVAFHRTSAFGSDVLLTLLCVTVAALVIVRHRSNIKRLLTGTENRLGGTGKKFTEDAAATEVGEKE